MSIRYATKANRSVTVMLPTTVKAIYPTRMAVETEIIGFNILISEIDTNCSFLIKYAANKILKIDPINKDNEAPSIPKKGTKAIPSTIAITDEVIDIVANCSGLPKPFNIEPIKAAIDVITPYNTNILRTAEAETYSLDNKERTVSGLSVSTI